MMILSEVITISTEERYRKFVEEYEKLCEKYEMRHDLYDMWDVGYESIHVYDERKKVFIVD